MAPSHIPSGKKVGSPFPSSPPTIILLLFQLLKKEWLKIGGAGHLSNKTTKVTPCNKKITTVIFQLKKVVENHLFLVRLFSLLLLQILLVTTTLITTLTTTLLLLPHFLLLLLYTTLSTTLTTTLLHYCTFFLRLFLFSFSLW